MIVIVDGIDRTGKSTLCKAIADTYGLKVYKSDCNYVGYTTEAANIARLDEDISLIEKGIIDDVVFDRFYLTELAYSMVSRGATWRITKMCLDMEDRLARFVRNNRSKIVLLPILVEPYDIEQAEEEHGFPLREQYKIMYAKANNSQLEYINMRADLLIESMTKVFEKYVLGQEMKVW